MRGTISPLKSRRVTHNDTCQVGLLTIPSVNSQGNEQNSGRHRSQTLAVPYASTAITPDKKPLRSNSLECENNIQHSTFEGLTTPQSQVMKVLYLSDKSKPKEHTEPSPTKKSTQHLTVDACFNASTSSSSCESLLSLTFSSTPQTPTNMSSNQEPQSPQEESDSVVGEGQIISSILVEIVRYLIIPFLDFVIYLCELLFIEKEDEKLNNPMIKVLSATGSNFSCKLSNHVGDLIYNQVHPSRDVCKTQEEVDDKKLKEVSLDIPETIQEEKSFHSKLFEQLVEIKKNLKWWLSTHKKTVFTRNGKSCRALVRNEVKHLNTLAMSEFSQAKSLTDLIDYWKKSI